MTDVLYESKVKNVLYQSKYNRIIQFAPIRTGSAVLWQMLDYLFEDRTYNKNKWKNPNYVVKAHKLNFYLNNLKNHIFFKIIKFGILQRKYPKLR